MSATVTRVQKATVPGNQRFTVSYVTLDSSYASEGESVTAADLGLKKVDFAMVNIVAGDEAKSSEQYAGVAYYDETNQKIRVINLKEGKEVASTKNLEKLKVKVLAFGR